LEGVQWQSSEFLELICGMLGVSMVFREMFLMTFLKVAGSSHRVINAMIKSTHERPRCYDLHGKKRVRTVKK
jgi:hypothetical protein